MFTCPVKTLLIFLDNKFCSSAPEAQQIQQFDDIFHVLSSSDDLQSFVNSSSNNIFPKIINKEENENYSLIEFE